MTVAARTWKSNDWLKLVLVFCESEAARSDNEML